MKYLKLFERFSTFEHDFGQFKIKVVDASPNNYDGGIQVDSATVTCDGKEYYFELHTPVGGLGEVHAKYLGGDDDEFINHFGLEEDTFIDEGELSEFLQVNDPDCVGYDTEIDGYEMEITDFHHDGGMELGTIETIINGEEIQFEMIQDATGGFGFGVEFDSDEDEEKAKKIGFELTDELREYLFNEYDRICTEKR